MNEKNNNEYKEKMNINWFPGHMNKALRKIEEHLKLADIIIYVLDSRAPFCCINPVFDRLFENKKIIYVLNKADLGSVSRVREWAGFLSGDNSSAVLIDSTASGSAKTLVDLSRKMCSEKLERYRAKGVKTSIRALVAGVPNSGKSTLINNLAGKAKTVTGDKPGVTRSVQWVRVNDYFEVLDTPGTLYPKIEDERVAKRLAYIGSIKDEIYDTVTLACALAGELAALDKQILVNRYKTEACGDNLKTLENMARARGYLVKGGEADTDRMATAFIDDFRKGRLGKITLDSIEEVKNAN